MKKKKGFEKEIGKKIFAEVSVAEYEKMLEIKQRTRYSIADQIRSAVRNLISNEENILKRG